MNYRLEFVVPGVPIYQQSRNKVGKCKKEIGDKARAAINAEWPGIQDVEVSVKFFIRLRSRNVPDVDNAAKPILDGLKGVAYADDIEVSDIICRKRYLDPRLNVTGASPVVIQAFSVNQPFVHVLVTEASIWEL